MRKEVRGGRSGEGRNNEGRSEERSEEGEGGVRKGVRGGRSSEGRRSEERSEEERSEGRSCEERSSKGRRSEEGREGGALTFLILVTGPLGRGLLPVHAMFHRLLPPGIAGITLCVHGWGMGVCMYNILSVHRHIIFYLYMYCVSA